MQLELTTYHNEKVITNFEIAKALEIDIRSVNRLIDKYKYILEEKSPVRFEITADSSHQKIYYLNENQALLLGTMQRNTKKVLEFKQALVTAYTQLRQYKEKLVLKTPTELTTVDILKLATSEIEKLQARIDRLVHNNKLYTTTEIAKELGLHSALELNKILEEKNIQYKANKTWVLYSHYSDKGYTSIKQVELDNGKIIYDRKWTGLGREFILDLF